MCVLFIFYAQIIQFKAHHAHFRRITLQNTQTVCKYETTYEIWYWIILWGVVVPMNFYSDQTVLTEFLHVWSRMCIGARNVSSKFMYIFKFLYSTMTMVSWSHLKLWINFLIMSLLPLNSSVTIATGYGMVFNSWQGQETFLFSTAFRPALGPTQPLIQQVLGALFSQGVKQLAWRRPLSHMLSWNSA
jgi:hypothetical protein